MGLNREKRGTDRGGKINFRDNTQCQSRIRNQEFLFTNSTGSPSFNFPLHSYSNKLPPSKKVYGFNSKQPFRNFSQKPFYNNKVIRNNLFLVIDLNKPWVTEEIKNEENKKQELVDKWKMFNSDENWSEYQKQKDIVQTLYTKAKLEFIKNHPNEAALKENNYNQKNFFCETCDKSFRTDDDLLLHESEHETCGLEGCTFTAHPKIISKHIKMQHKTGLYKRIGKLYTQEDINKWIEERKRRYPTAKVVEEKKILEQEKINRGEKIKEDNSKFNKSFINRNKKSFKKNDESKPNKRNKKTRKKKKTPTIQICPEEETLSARKGVPAFSGINNDIDNKVCIKNELPTKDINISDDDWEAEIKTLPVEQPCINGSLRLLADMYNSEEEVEEEKIKTETMVSSEQLADDESPEEVKTVCSKLPEPEEKEENTCKRQLSIKKNINPRKKPKVDLNECIPQKRSLTLLEKLLKSEIRRERNVILQCVNYIVKNKFFQQ